MDGLIICADTQETITGYSKIDTQKITVYADAPGKYNVVFTGAGDSVLIDTFIDSVIDSLSQKELQGHTRVGSEIKSCLVQSFRDHIVPWASFPRDDRPTVELLIGVQCETSTRLYHFEGTGFSHCTSPKCIGTGVALANSLIRQLFTNILPISQAFLAATYILRQCKRWVDGCGGNTDIITLAAGNLKLSRVPSSDVAELERHFDEFLTYIHPMLITIADSKVNEDQIDQVVRQFRLNILGLRGRFMQTEDFFRRLEDLLGFKIESLSTSSNEPALPSSQSKTADVKKENAP
jgi:hypothetical protein